MEKNIKQLFIDFIENRCTPSEIERVQKLMREDFYEQQWKEAIDETGNRLSDEAVVDPGINEVQLFNRISISAGIVSKAPKLYNWISYAAGLIVCVGIGFWFLKAPQIKNPQPVVKVALPVPSVVKSAEHKWIKLPDGSSVQLNANSHLDYPESFAGSANREVTLEGEGYFDIKHDAKHPFIIHTGKIKTTVLGTAFNISAYHAEAGVTVTVTRGKVMVQDEQKTLAILTPDQQLVWNKQAPPIKSNVKVESILAWKKSDLIMDDITLADAAKMITERYGISVRFKNDKVKDCRFTATFLNRNEISQVLTVLGDITGASLTLNSGVVTIDGSGC
ncbi:FecR domain-containing protein [Pedobacter sp. MC2016-14]|uniref:FecR family protein n=1 Tax=Pedobacter sp. MC2016-14 TaxID=2897327 RepID=UPI001E4FA74A|nr:FecR family protein [Pedobacter sp. MC2016-14]MCD0489402.1 FecR domain-containing protein [Pedobacter sp. MC2016-14]